MRIFAVALATLLASPAWAGPVVEMKTSMGTIEIELNEEKAPISTKNFLAYVNDKFYDGTIFHRVIKDFMIQGGGFDAKMGKRDTKAPIKNEGKNGLINERGTIAMARTMDPDSATAQFFINHKDNAFLDPNPKNPAGYAVFGKVTSGMDVVDKIAGVKTGVSNGMRDVPTEVVTIESVRLQAAAKSKKSAKTEEKKKETKPKG